MMMGRLGVVAVALALVPPAGAQEAATVAPAAEAAAVVAPVAAEAVAQAAVAAAAPDTPCELHVWPAERFQAMTSGWGAAFGVLGALAEANANAEADKARRSTLASALDPEAQLALLSGRDLAADLGLRPSRIVAHATPLDRKTMNKVKTRRAESTSPCYAELIVADVIYQKAALYGRSLSTLFMVRDFGADGAIDREYKAWGGNGLQIFPPKEGEDVGPALDELNAKFTLNFEEFARNARRSAERAGASAAAR
jgi:hypothetical protein